jgi:inorganic pyrophosphatase
MDRKVNIYIEIEKDSNMKYEFNKETKKLELDRILPYPYRYPYCYGYITNTLALDGDELDCLIITDKEIEKDKHYEAYIVGVLVMSDEKGMDEKILCVLKEDYATIDNLNKISKESLDNINWFFCHYKSKTPGKWSRVNGFREKEIAIQIYRRACCLYASEKMKEALSL